MGLLGGDPFDTGDPMTNLAIIGGLLGRRMGEGGAAPILFQAAQMKSAQQQQERQNRQNDLQQLQGAYAMLKQQEFAKMLQARQQGQPYMPNPMLPQMEAKLAELTGLGNLSGRLTPAAQVPPVNMQRGQSAAVPAMMPQPQNPMSAPMPQQSMTAPQMTRQLTPSDQSGLGGPAGGIPMEAWLAQDPSGASYLKQLAEDNKPIVLRQGDLVKKNANGSYSSAYQQPQLVPGVIPQRDANGQVIGAREIPGFAPAASNIKGAETSATRAAEAPFNFQNVTTGSGATVPMSVAQLMGGARQQPTQSSQGVAQLTVTEPSRSFTPSQPSQSADQFSDIPKIAEAGGIGQTTYQANLAKLRADQAAKLAETYGNNADTANKRIALNNQAASLIDRSDTGTGAALISDVKNVLVSRFGIPEGDFANDPAATQVLQKDLLNAATAKAKQTFGARMTQSEVMMMLKRGAPNVDMVKSAIKFLLETDNLQANYDIQQAQHFGEYLGKGGDPLQFQSYYARKFPLTKQEESLSLPKGGKYQFDANGNPK